MLTALTSAAPSWRRSATSSRSRRNDRRHVAARRDHQALAALDDRTKELSEIDKRIESLKESAKQAEQTTQKALGRMASCRNIARRCSIFSSQAPARSDARHTEEGARDARKLRGSCRRPNEVKQSLGASSTLKTELDQIRAVAATLTQDYAKIREPRAKRAKEPTAAMSTVKEVETSSARWRGSRRARHRWAPDALTRSPSTSRQAKPLDTQRSRSRRRRAGQPCERDGLGDGRPDRQLNEGMKQWRAPTTRWRAREARRRDQRPARAATSCG